MGFLLAILMAFVRVLCPEDAKAAELLFFTCPLDFWSACEESRSDESVPMMPRQDRDILQLDKRTDLPEPVRLLLSHPDGDSARTFVRWYHETTQRVAAATDEVRKVFESESPQVANPPLTTAGSTSTGNSASAVLVAQAEREPTDSPGRESPVLDLIYFFSPECPFCREQNPILSRLYEAYRDKIGFLAIALGSSREATQKYVAGRIDFLTKLDHGEGATFHVTETPTIVLLQGDQAYRFAGLTQYADLARQIDRLLGENP